MKIQIHKDLRRRLMAAADNGSKIAQIIVEEISKDVDSSEILNSKTTNYFDCIRLVGAREGYQSVQIAITCCPKDLDNEHFPDKGRKNAQFYEDNRTRKNAVMFAKMFVRINNMWSNGELMTSDFEYFDNAIRVSRKITVEISGEMEDIARAYDGRNYAMYSDGAESTLHKSCMRHAEVFNVCGDFYSGVGAKIVYAHDDEGNIYGRAMMWPEVEVIFPYGSMKTSVLDRIYTCFDFVRQLIIKKATDEGVGLRKTVNTYDSKTNFTVLNDITTPNGEKMVAGRDTCWAARVRVPLDEPHKRGVPYLDTFTYLRYRCVCDEPYAYLCNDSSVGKNCTTVCTLDGTHLIPKEMHHYVCPVCGNPTYSNEGCIEHVCDYCRDEVANIKETIVGEVAVGDFKEYKGMMFPAACFDEDGNPKNALLLHEFIARILCVSRFA